MNISRQLKNIRLQNKLTQQQLADALKITASAYCSYEIGRRTPDVDTIVKLSAFYKLPVDSFLGQMDISVLEDVTDIELNSELRFLSQLSKDELDLIVKYRIMDDGDKGEVASLADRKVKNK